MALDLLNKLAQQVPNLNPEAAARTQAAGQNLAYIQAAKMGQVGAGTAGKVQQLAEQDVNQRAQAELQAQQQRQIQQQQAAEMALAEQQAQQRAMIQNQELAANKEIEQRQLAETERLAKYGIEQDNSIAVLSRGNQRALANLSQDVEQKLFNSTRQFEKTEMGRKFTNERQLALWTIANAKNQEDLQTKMQRMQIASDRKIQLLQVAQAKIIQQKEQEYLAADLARQGKLKVDLAEFKRKSDEAIQAEKTKAANNSAMLSAGLTIGGMVLGGIAGAIAGAPAGGVGAIPAAMAGASLGGSLGGAAAAGVNASK